MPLKLYNTLTKKKQNFKPIKKNNVGLYTCGPTVYNYAHIGNLRAYIFSDLLRRTLEFNSLKVKHVMNITDVGHLTGDADHGEEKMSKGAKREKLTVWQVAAKFTKAFKEDLKHLNIQKPTIYCKATDHIKEQINLIKKLEKKGLTYTTSDGVYYNTAKFKNYVNFANLKLDEKNMQARVKENPEKKHPWDFALWKFTIGKHKHHLMKWKSPWGVGFPGWHIECSAMSIHFLGKHFDIHTGGIDHIQIHHTNEIAQVEPLLKKKWVNWWMHGEFLVLKDKEKMAKSGENFIILKTLENHNLEPLDYRYFCLTASYRSPLMFSWQALNNAQTSWNHLKNQILDLKENPTSKPNEKANKKLENNFLKAINDDLNMPVALSVMYDAIKEKTLGNKQKLSLLLKFDKVLGLGFKELKRTKITLTKEQKALLKERETARKNKDWKKADKARDKLKKQGILIEDTPEGPRWKKA